MKSIILLDAGVIGTLTGSPIITAVADCKSWYEGLRMAGKIVTIPDITLYEVRRELNRLQAGARLARLGALIAATKNAPVTPEAWFKAAELWALVRSAGKPTADPHALDGDAILAGVATTIGSPGDLVTIATSNVGHLTRFPGVDARRWEDVA